MGVFSSLTALHETFSSLFPCSGGKKECWDPIVVLPVSGCWDILKQLLTMSEDPSEVAWNKASLTSDGREIPSLSSDLSRIPLKQYS